MQLYCFLVLFLLFLLFDSFTDFYCFLVLFLLFLPFDSFTDFYCFLVLFPLFLPFDSFTVFFLFFFTSSVAILRFENKKGDEYCSPVVHNYSLSGARRARFTTTVSSRFPPLKL